MAFLLLMATSMFQEGSGKTKAVAKTGTAAKLNNELVWNAKDVRWTSSGRRAATSR